MIIVYNSALNEIVKSVFQGISTRSQVSSINEYKASERKVDDYLNKGIMEDNILDSEKQVQEQLNFLKNKIKKLNII